MCELMSEGDFDFGSNDYISRPTIIGKIKKKIYTKTFASKWANLKLFLKEKKSLESSVKLRKKSTIDQFSSKCQEIFKKKVEIYLITKKNRQLLKSFNKENEYLTDDINQKISKMKIYDASKKLDYMSDNIKEFFFAFRTNNELMLRLIECADKSQYEKLVPFLCHFFYENFYMENSEQEEMLYIIYLLLEKEIDSLLAPSVSSFLGQSFLSSFLTEMSTRYELKLYISIILSELIKQIEEKNIIYNSMDIVSNNHSKNKEGVYYDMLEEDSFSNVQSEKYESMNKIRNDSFNNNQMNYPLGNNILFKEQSKLKKKSVVINPGSKFLLNQSEISISDSKNNSNYVSNSPLKKDINEDLFNNINEKFLKIQLKETNDEIMKEFYIRHLRKIQSAKNCDLFNGNLFYNKLKKEKKIFKSCLDEFNASYLLITNFINNLLTNLENSAIIPYEIRVICYFINTLLQKRFKKISKIQCNILICQYLFDKLIFPVLQNPDAIDVGKDMIISINTRKTLSDIYEVCKKLIRGELFTNNDNNCYFVIFNKFIINNIQRINDIIEKIIHIKPSGKLLDLSEQFYSREDFDLKKLKRNEWEINYKYLEENKNDFTQHKSICFSIKDLFLFYHIVEKNIEYFKEIKKSFDEITGKTKLEIDKTFDNIYFIITNDEYAREVNDLLNHDENKLSLIKVKNMENLFKIKSCIEYVLNNVDISPNWKWVSDNWDTYKTFQFIHNYLTTYNLDSRNYLKNKESKIPLSWYSLYIINNINKLKGNYAINDFKMLYDNLESEINSQLKKLRKLNNFLTINMRTKFILIDRKIKIFNQELENVQKTELSLKTFQFIENTKIRVCLTTINDLFEISKYIQNFYDHFDLDSKNKFVFVIRQNKTECIHKRNMDNKHYQKEKISIKKMHCKNINQFCLHFTDYYRNIFQDIIKNNNQECDDNQKNQKMKYRQISTKDVLEIFMEHLTELIKASSIFKEKTDIDIKNSLSMIRNYILKNIYIKVNQNDFDEKDKQFRILCKKLAWIKPENLEIQKGVFNSSLLKKVEYHIKKMDDLSNPNNMLEQLNKGVQLVNSMFSFMLNQTLVEPGELLKLIIYGIINLKPKKLNFSINFIKYFMDENQKKENIGFNLIRAESSMNYIQSLSGAKLKMDEQEFDKRCDECINLKTINKYKSINDDSDWD